MTCDLLGIKRSTFYEKESRTPSQRDRENQELREQILRIWMNSKKRYGAPKIRMRLNEKRAKKEQGAVGINRVQRLMRELGIHSITKKKYKHHASKANHDPLLKDLIGRDFRASTPFEKLVSDITYIHTARHGWCYLAVIMDVYSKAVIGWSFSKKMDARLTSDALKKVIKKGLFHRGTILHSDRGSQYTAHAYRALAKKYGFQQSFSAVGCPYDNASIESFNAVLKKELVHHEKYDTYQQAHISLFQYIEAFYNNQRIHGSINYRTPNEMLKSH